MYLLLPEWQGYGLSAAPADGARDLGAALFAGRDATTIDAPAHESLTITDGVLGLDSIVVRFVQTLETIRAAAPERIVTVGATCGVELAPVTYLNSRYSGDLAVLWLDGHADLNTPESSPSGHFHGMVLRTLLGDGPFELVDHISLPLEPRQVFLVGPRDLDPPENEFIHSEGICTSGIKAFLEPRNLIRQVRGSGFSRVYVHLDVDVLNPDDFPASLMRTPGGPTLAQVNNLLEAIHRDLNVVGFSVVEYCGGTDETRERLVGAIRPWMD